MEGRTRLVCGDCGRLREVSGEMPHEYRDCFARFVAEEGWVPRPGSNRGVLICGACSARYEGSETRDDGENIRDGSARNEA